MTTAQNPCINIAAVCLPSTNEIAGTGTCNVMQEKLALTLIDIACKFGSMRTTMSNLGLHESVEVRCAVAECSSTPPELLWKLSQDESPDVRYHLAGNHNISINVLFALTADENPYVADRAERTLDRLFSECHYKECAVS